MIGSILFKLSCALQIIMLAVGKEIGKGAESVVTVDRLHENNELIAFKTANSVDFHRNLKKESKILTLFDHPHIIKVKKPYELIDSVDGGQIARLGLELSMEGSVFEYMYSTQEGLPKRIAKFYLIQLLDALEELQEKQIVHQDLKPENFLLFNKGGVIKIADFGMYTDLNPVLEKKKSQESPKARINGTYTYMAPECHGGDKSFKSDVFSMMVSAFVLLYGFIPFESAKITDKMYRLIVTSNDVEYTKTIKKISGSVDPVFLDLFFKGVKYQPSQRITLPEIRQHPWFTEDIGSQSEAESYIQDNMKTVRGDFISKLQDL